MRMRRKKNLVPRMERCAAYQVKEPEAMRGRWKDLYPQAEEIWVEIGCGKGKAQALELKNVFFICADAARLGDIFAPGETDRIFLNFSDPWPSKRHCRRRLTHAGFLLSYRQALRDGGEIHFKTDNRPLFDFSLTQFPAAGYTVSQVTNDLHANGVQGVMTDYEAKFSAEGVPINRCVAAKGPLPDPFVMPEDVSLIPFGYVEGTKYGR